MTEYDTKDEKDTKVIATAIQKGGVGKTTQCYNLIDFISRQFPDKNILAIDIDFQSSLSEAYGYIESPNSSINIYEGGEVDIISISDNIDLIPAHPNLAFTSEKLRAEGRQNVYFILEDWFINNYDRIKKYDYIFIDTHPDSSTVTMNAIATSDIQLAFIDPSRFGYNAIPKSIGSLESLVEETRDRRTKEILVNTELVLVGNKIKRNETLSRNLTNKLESNFSNYIGYVENKSLFDRSTQERKPIFELLENPEILNINGNKEFKKRLSDIYMTIVNKIDEK